MKRRSAHVRLVSQLALADVNSHEMTRSLESPRRLTLTEARRPVVFIDLSVRQVLYHCFFKKNIYINNKWWKNEEENLIPERIWEFQEVGTVLWNTAKVSQTL